MREFAFRLLKETLISICALIFGSLFVILLKEPIEFKLMPIIYDSWTGGRALHLYPSDGSKPQKYRLFSSPLFNSNNGRFISLTDMDEETGSYKQFYMNIHKKNDLTFFSYVRDIKNRNSGGVFIGRRLEGRDIIVGTLNGIDKWEGDKECTLHKFAAVIGRAEDSDTFAEYAAKELGGMHDKAADFKLSIPCIQPS